MNKMSKAQQRKKAECVRPRAGQVRIAHLDHSGVVSRRKDRAVVVHVRNVDVDRGRRRHGRNAAVYCLDEQGVSRHLPKHKGPTVKKGSLSFPLGPLRGAAGLAVLCGRSAAFTLGSLDRGFSTSAPLT